MEAKPNYGHNAFYRRHNVLVHYVCTYTLAMALYASGVIQFDAVYSAHFLFIYITLFGNFIL